MWRNHIRKLLSPCLAAALLLALCGAAEAGVTLVPRVNSKGEILKDESSAPIVSEDYVLFGKFRHRLEHPAGASEDIATPILWRVMSLDVSPSPTKAILLSHRLLESMSYQGQVVSVGHGTGNPKDTDWYRSPDRHIYANRWDGSEVQKWLNDASQATSYPVYLAENYWEIEPTETSKQAHVEGFLHRFADEERNALLAYPDGTANGAGSKVTLPSGWLERWNDQSSRKGEIALWFGFSENGAPYKEPPGGTPGGRRDYWTRTPLSGNNSSDITVGVRYVVNTGDINYAPAHEGDSGAYGVRPGVLLNLREVLFKSASGDFDLSSTPALGGTESNPWVPVLGGLAPLDWQIKFESSNISPQSAAIDATGKIMTVTWADPISPAVRRWPSSADFTLRRPGGRSNPVSVASDDAHDNILILTFADATFQGETLSLGYNLNTDAISCDKSGTTATDVVGSFANFPVTNNSTVTPPDSGPTPSNETKPGSVSATADGAKYDGELQIDGRTFLITVPYGTDISNLSVDATPPKGGSVSPDMPVSHDFTRGPLTFTITAEDGTKKNYTIDVKVEEQKQPAERTLFTVNVNDCEIVVTQNADGTLAVKIRIPFAAGANPALLDTVKMIASSLGLSNISYVRIDAQGSETPVAARTAAKAPYLEIRGTAANIDAIENGVITQMRYTLKGDNGLYAQTFPNGGLKISNMPGYPSPEPAPSGSSSGCDAGAAWGAIALIALAGGAMNRRR